MKVFYLFLAVCLCTQAAIAQSTVKVYYSDADYAYNNYDTMQDVTIVLDIDGSYNVSGPKRKVINKKVWAVERNDSLWLNNHIVLAPNPDYVPRRSGIKYKPKGYELVSLRSLNYLCFRGPRANVKWMYGQRHVPDQSISAPLPIAVAVNAAVISAETDYAHLKPIPRFNYVYDMLARETVYLSHTAMEEYYHRATGKADTSFRKFLLKLAQEK